MEPEFIANHNFEQLRQNPYPGRGLVVGRASQGEAWLILYWIMGRSTNSRNRRFVAEGGALRTEPVDLKLVSNPSLIIYEAMLELPGIFIASNGDQTRTVYEAIRQGKTFEVALSTREREPDAPNFTPRITGMLDFIQQPTVVALNILKANPLDPKHTDRYTYCPSFVPPGFAFGLTTYSGDGNPLPSFSGDPLLLPLKGNANAVLEAYWSALNAENRVSLAVKEIDPQGKHSRILIQNRY
jgi:IMP cyclohydrolase